MLQSVVFRPNTLAFCYTRISEHIADAAERNFKWGTGEAWGKTYGFTCIPEKIQNKCFEMSLFLEVIFGNKWEGELQTPGSTVPPSEFGLWRERNLQPIPFQAFFPTHNNVFTTSLLMILPSSFVFQTLPLSSERESLLVSKFRPLNENISSMPLYSF